MSEVGLTVGGHAWVAGVCSVEKRGVKKGREGSILTGVVLPTLENAPVDCRMAECGRRRLIGCDHVSSISRRLDPKPLALVAVYEA